jgi:hypothetical protein
MEFGSNLKSERGKPIKIAVNSAKALSSKKVLKPLHVGSLNDTYQWKGEPK